MLHRQLTHSSQCLHLTLALCLCCGRNPLERRLWHRDLRPLPRRWCWEYLHLPQLLGPRQAVYQVCPVAVSAQLAWAADQACGRQQLRRQPLSRRSCRRKCRARHLC